MLTELPGISVTLAWLREQGRDDVVVADVRWVAGGSARAAFEQGHLPGAVSFDLDRDLARPAFDGPGRHPLPGPASFAQTMSAAGIGDDTPVVVYDDVGGWVAARLWWMLHVTGHPVALLDLPTLEAWTAAGGSLIVGSPVDTAAAAMFTEQPWPTHRVVDADQVRAALVDGTAVVLDARSGERYRGEVEPIDPVAGHIPGSVNAAWQGNREAAGGVLLSPDAMRHRYEALGVHDGNRAIALCGSGITASFAVFAMELAGLRGAKLYEGSWSDWTHDPSRPVATGPEPGDLA